MEFEVKVKIDDSYEIVERVEAKDEFNAIKSVRERIKKEIKPQKMWIYDMRRV